MINYRSIVSKLPTELADLVKSFCNPSEEYWQEKIDNVAKKHGLNVWGFNTETNPRLAFDIFSKSNLKNIIKCKNQIHLIFKPLKHTLAIVLAVMAGNTE